MSLFDQVAAKMNAEFNPIGPFLGTDASIILANVKSRRNAIRAKVYPKPAPYKEPEVVMVPKPLKPDPKMAIWDRGNAFALQCLHDCEVIQPKKTYKALADILREVSRKRGIDANDIKKIDGYASRKHPITMARQEFFYLACSEKIGKDQVYSLPRIGKFLGGFDHTTVLHGRIAHGKRMEQEARD